MTTTKDRHGVQQTEDGYVARVRCGKSHGGSKGLAGPTGDSYECQGCRTFYHVGTVQAAQAASVTGGLQTVGK